ncbi:MAG: sugar ABC transporter permease, partial [Collimonas sp.]|uniref:sugar ABC transporter permease n=1 Tax=Collimonas sp. TaxID=1963772 RepID=UPI003266552E
MSASNMGAINLGAINIKQLFRQYKIMALLIAIAIIWAFFSWKTEGGFVTPRNLSNLLRQMSITGILACGMVLVIIGGEIDLSVGSMLGLLGGVAAVLDVTHHLPLPLNLALVLVLGLCFGLFNGYLTAYMRIPSFIVGLGGMLAFRGILLGVTGGLTIAPVSSGMVYLGQGYLPPQLGIALGLGLFALALGLTWRQRSNRQQHALPVPPLWRDALRVLAIGAILLAFVRTLNTYDGIPVPVLLLLALLGLFSYITTQTVFGRRIYSVGSNMEATR